MSTESDLKQKAAEEGFFLAGIARVAAFEGYDFYLDWLAAGHHAGMDYLVRHAEARRSLDAVLPGARSAVVVGLNYAQPLPHQPGRVKVARYAQGRDYHRVIRQRLERVATALPGGEWRVAVDSAPVLERELAHRAGLGWFGKNSMLIDSRRGSYFLIGTLLTTLELQPDAPSEGGCGTCHACIAACPTGAIVFENERGFVDARRCISYWTIEHRGDIPAELSARFGDWTFGCDICQEVCPFNAPRASQPLRAQTTEDPEMLPRGPWPNLDAPMDWETRSPGSPIRRATEAGFERNRAINRANAASASEYPPPPPIEEAPPSPPNC